MEAEGKYVGLKSTPLHKKHLFDKQSIVRTFTYIRDERKARRLVFKALGSVHKRAR